MVTKQIQFFCVFFLTAAFCLSGFFLPDRCKHLQEPSVVLQETDMAQTPNQSNAR